jgi:hypothetical protein
LSRKPLSEYISRIDNRDGFSGHGGDLPGALIGTSYPIPESQRFGETQPKRKATTNSGPAITPQARSAFVFTALFFAVSF